jgi:hypothetical protein
MTHGVSLDKNRELNLLYWSLCKLQDKYMHLLARHIMPKPCNQHTTRSLISRRLYDAELLEHAFLVFERPTSENDPNALTGKVCGLLVSYAAGIENH